MALIDPANKNDLDALFADHNILPQKNMGQHFLIDKTVRDAVLAHIIGENTVMEVGPGPGALTVKLAKRYDNVIAVEKDPRMVAVLKDVLARNAITNTNIVTGDILQYLASARYDLDTVIGALPYYLTSYFFRVLLEQSSLQWKRGVFIIQQEVAERITATPPFMNLLGISVQLFAVPSLISSIPPSSFQPKPEVTSALLTLTPKRNGEQEIRRATTIVMFAKRAFSEKRKQLKNTIPLELLTAAGIDPTMRPQNLSLDDWRAIAQYA